MKKLSKSQAENKERLVRLAHQQRDQLEEALIAVNRQMAILWDKVNAKEVALNVTLDEMEALRVEIHEEMSEYFEDKSEKWQESEKGEDFACWMSNFETGIELIELRPPDDVEMPDVDFFSFENAPNELE